MTDELAYPKQVQAYYLAKGYTPIQAAAMAANSAHEGPDSPTQTGDSGTAFGRFQWRGGRQTDLQNYAKQNGLDPNDTNTQLGFADWELHNTEANPAGREFFSATTPEEANDAMMKYLRPAGSEKGPRGVPSYNSRLQMAQQLQGLPQSVVALANPGSQNVSTPGTPAMQQPDAKPQVVAANSAAPIPGLLAVNAIKRNQDVQQAAGLLAMGAPTQVPTPQFPGLLSPYKPRGIALPNLMNPNSGLLGTG